jgi:hypothetical protein
MTDNGFADDLEALAELGYGLEGFDLLASSGKMPEGAFATFTMLEPDRQRLVVRLLDEPTADDLRELAELPDHERVNLSRWLLTLPGFNGPAIDDEDDG